MTHHQEKCEIVCSAIKLENGHIYRGLRHHNCIMKAHEAGEQKPLDTNQGFWTSDARYVSREEAAVIAYEAGQIKEPKETLYSEDLWTNHAPSPHTEGVDEKIHKPVIETMNTLGYGLLKDGNTFYKKGYELYPRLVVTFSMNQAYEIHKALHQTREDTLAGYEAELNYGGYCQACGFRVDICDAKPCRVKKIMQRQRLKGGGK